LDRCFHVGTDVDDASASSQATASVDFATDVLIQQSIRSDLQGVTLITIGASVLLRLGVTNRTC
jgi:hypothetical protein